MHFDGALCDDFLRLLGKPGVRRIGVQPRLLTDFEALLGLHRRGPQPGALHPRRPPAAGAAQLAGRAADPHHTEVGRVLDVDAVQAVMRSHLHGSLYLRQAGAQFKLSRFHFAKTYRALTGHAPIQDFIQLKMAQACRLLDQGSLEVRQIAEQLGYDDPYYFSRLFRKVVGMAPSHYRALHRG